MVIPYYEEIEKKKINYELANLNSENIEKGVKSTILSTVPSYILPDNTLYYTTRDHYNSKFYREIEECLEIIAKSSIKPKIEFFDATKHGLQSSGRNKGFFIYEDEIFLDDPHIYNLTNEEYKLICNYFSKKLVYKTTREPDKINEDKLSVLYREKKMNQLQRLVINYNSKEDLEIRKNRLLDNQKEIVKNGLSALDVGIFLNYNCISFSNFGKYSDTRDLYNQNCKKLILAIIESKIKVYSYFIETLITDEYGINLLEALENYPGKDYWKKKYDSNNSRYAKLVDLPISDSDDRLEFLKNKYFIQDFSVQALGFDKIESQLNRTITTSKESIYEPFFNYLIMDYNVHQISKIKYCSDKNEYEVINRNGFVKYACEKNLEEEIQLIKKYIPYSERNRYFR